jgi:maltose O-acetyltransferase
MYDPFDAELVAGRERARTCAWTSTRPANHSLTSARRILRELFGAGGDSVWMQPPF